MQLRLPSIPTHSQNGSAPTILRQITMMVASLDVFVPSGFAGSVCCLLVSHKRTSVLF